MTGEKTEKPTARRLAKAREEGQVAKSTDLNGALILGAAFMAFSFYGSYAGSILMGLMQNILGNPYQLGEASTSRVLNIVQELGGIYLSLAGPIFAVVTVAALASNIMQVGFNLTGKPLVPSLDKLNPISGFKRLWSLRSVVELLKGLLKMGLVGGVGYMVIASNWNDLLQLTYGSVWDFFGLILKVMLQLMLGAVMAYLVLGFGDWRYQAFEHEKKLRMSKQDIKDENKNLEGDLQMKAKMRQMGQSFVKQQQIAKVPTADVVITNPTHYAVALRYDPDIAPAPHVVAKGLDNFALKIREVAKENGVEIIENRPLARSLYGSVDYGEIIPPDLFVAVAEVLALVYRKNGGRQLYDKKKARIQAKL